MSILFKITPEDRTYGLIVGKTGYIVTENDLCHSICKTDEKVELVTRLNENHQREYEEYTLAQLQDVAEPVEWKDFVHYWGIKERVRRNYSLLQDSLKQIGIDAVLPKWGER